MLSDPKHDDRLDRLTERLRLAPALTADLMSHVVSECLHAPSDAKAGWKGKPGSTA